MKRIPLIIALCFMLAFSACKNFSLSDANLLQKGMNSNTVLNIASKDPRIVLKNPATNVEVQIYALKLGDYTSDYYAAFKNDKLVYWGYPYEFARHSDPLITEINAWVVGELLKN